MNLFGQLEELEPNDYGQSGIKTIEFNIENIGVNYTPPPNNEDDHDPALIFERDVWYVPAGSSGAMTISYSGTNTGWFEMYTSNSNYDPYSGSKVIESYVNDTSLVYEFDESLYYFIEVVGQPDSSNVYSFNVATIEANYKNTAGQTFSNLLEAIDLMPNGGVISLLKDFEDNTVNSIPAGITLVNHEYELIFVNSIILDGEIVSKGTVIGDLIVNGKITGGGSLIGNITNNGEIKIGGIIPELSD